MAKTPHTSFPKGKRVIVGLKDGTKIVDKFIRRDKSRKIVVLENQTIELKKIRFMGYYKPSS